MARALSLSRGDFMPSTYGIEKDSLPTRLPQLAIFCEDFFELARTSSINPPLLKMMVALLRILHHNSCMPLESLIPVLKEIRNRPDPQTDMIYRGIADLLRGGRPSYTKSEVESLKPYILDAWQNQTGYPVEGLQNLIFEMCLPVPCDRDGIKQGWRARIKRKIESLLHL